MSLEDARRVVQRVGLSVGDLRVTAKPGPAGVVLEQDPAAGSRIFHGSRINLVISGKEDS
jgi:beta-lactam-binding protein with PASTA domain